MLVKRPLLAPLAGLIAGITCCGLLSISVPASIALASFFVASVTIFLPNRRLHSSALLLLFFCAGVCSASSLISPQLSPDDISRFAGGEPIRVEGIVASRPETRGDASKVTIAVERVYRDGTYASVTGRLLLHIRKGRPAVVTGDRIRVLTSLRIPETYGIPGEFDYRKFLAWRGIHVTGTVREAEDLILMETRARHASLWRMDRLSRRLVDAIREAVPSEEGGVLAALILGELGGVSPETEDAYAAAGVNHVLSISGFHMAVVSLTLFQTLLFITRRIPALALRFNLRRDLMPATLPVLVMYLFLVGPSYAAVRSVIMIAVCIAALWVERETDGLNILMLAALAIVMFQPGSLFDISFQLSFLALWGLLVLSPLLIDFFGEGRGFRRTVIVHVAASLAAIAATFLPVLFYFNRASLIGVVANAAVIPLMGYGAVVSGVVALPLVFLFPQAADALFNFAGFLVYLSDMVVVKLATLPMVPAWRVTRTDLIVFLALLLVMTFLRGKQRKMAAIPLVISLVALPVLRKAPSTDNLRLTFFSLGQSEASLLRYPDGTTMLIDGGGSLFDGGADIGTRLLGPALRSLGVTKIDHMILTHPHPDHLKGLLHVAAFFPVGAFWEGGASVSGKDHLQLRRILADKNVPVQKLAQDVTTFPVGKARVAILAPGISDGDAEDQGNESSLVVRVTYGANVFLFTGDIGFPRENELVRRKDLVRCDVLKVPHHGSRYSSSDEFLSACNARIALISAGRRNTFHLPSGDALERLRRHRMIVYRTDLDGTIDIESDGTMCRVTTFKDRYY